MMLLLQMRVVIDSVACWRQREGKRWGARQLAVRRHLTRGSGSGPGSVAYVGSKGTRGLLARTGVMHQSLFGNQQGAKIVELKVTVATTATKQRNLLDSIKHEQTK